MKRQNDLLLVCVVISLIGFIVAVTGFGRFANQNVSGEELYKRKEYGPHFLTGSLLLVNVVLMSYHGVYGRKTLGLICCVIALFSLFAGGVSFDKDAHTIATGWREPGRPATYSDPVGGDVALMRGNRWPNCRAKVSYDKTRNDGTVEQVDLDFDKACTDIELSLAGNIIYAFANLVALVAIPMCMKSPIRPERNKLMFIAMIIIFIGWIVYSVGFYRFADKYDSVREFGTRGSPSFIPSARLYEEEEFTSMWAFAIVAAVMWLVALVCIYRITYNSMYLCGIAAMFATYTGGMGFGYSGRLVHAGFRTNYQIWGPPFGEKGPLDCDYNAETTDACRLMAVTAGGAAIALFGTVLLYLACYFAITGDLIFGQLNAQAWYNGQMWLTSYPTKKMDVVPSNKNASEGPMWVNPQPDPTQGAMADARA